MRLLLTTGIFPPDHGGPASYVPTIASALAKRGHVIAGVVTLSDRLDVDDEDLGYPVYRIRRAQSPLMRLVRVVTLIRSLAPHVDAVYLNGLVFEGVIACKLLARRRVIVKVVGDLIWERARNQRAFAGELLEFQAARLSVKWRWLRWLQSWYTGRADLVICPSQYLARVVTGWGVPSQNVRVVYNSVESGSAQSKGFAEPAFDVVTVARLVPWKGIGELVEIAAARGWSLKVVGDGPLRAELEQLAQRLGAGSRIVFAGHVTREQARREICSARVLVLNSSYEGLPHIVLEAKQAGIPVVATSAGGTPEVVNDGADGFLVDVGDGLQLQQRIAQLLADADLRARLTRAAHAQVERQFSFDVMVRETERALGAPIKA